MCGFIYTHPPPFQSSFSCGKAGRTIGKVEGIATLSNAASPCGEAEGRDPLLMLKRKL